MATTKEKRHIGSEALQDVVLTRADREASVLRDEERIVQDAPRCADEAALKRGERRESSQRGAWQRVIDHKLIEWGGNPEKLEDEGVNPPTRETISRAIRLAEAYRDESYAPPDSVVPDPDGGIVFERRDRDVSEVLHVWEDGTVEYQLFQGVRLVVRRTL